MIRIRHGKITKFIANNQGHFLPLYPGTLFPACPGGGVLELPNPMHDAVIGDPVSGEINIIYHLTFKFEIMMFLQCMPCPKSPSLPQNLSAQGIDEGRKCII